MGKRIRYQNQKGKINTLISVQDFVSDTTGAKYKVVLDLDNGIYKIRSERTKEFIVKSEAHGNMNVLKKNARAHLEKLGVSLSRESRDRTFGQCEKGFTQEKWEKEND